MPSFKFRERIGEISTALRDEFDQFYAGLQQDAANVGRMTDVAFDATNFSGGGKQLWTVGRGSQDTYAYEVTGRRMTLHFSVLLSTVGGTADVSLRIALPPRVAALRSTYGTYHYSDNGTYGVGLCGISTGQTWLSLFLANPTTNWAAATETTSVRGQFVCEIVPLNT